jgi:hypothetical protein
MAQTASIVASQFVTFLSDTTNGIASAIANLSQNSGITLPSIPVEQIISQNVPPAIAEKAAAVKYPVVNVYSNRVRNLLTEKFRTFSGKVQTVAEVRVSQDRIEGIEDQTRLYVDAVTQVLDSNRGSWGQGMFYTGGYDISFDPVQHGGKNLIQIARVTFEVDLSS